MYFEFCKNLHASWQANKLILDQHIHSYFDLNAVPEPYLFFDKADDPLYFLTTNPGGVLDFQKRQNFTYQQTYHELAPILGQRYLANQDKISHAALRMINRVRALAKEINKSGVIQVETIPFHSKDLRNKDGFLTRMTDSTLLSYIKILKSHLKDKHVISVQAGKPDLRYIQNRKWIQLLADTMNLNLQKAKIVPIKVKESGKVTVGLLLDKENNKGIVFTEGANNFPDDHGMNLVAQAWNK